MSITKECFINQFAQLALDERISLFMGAGGSCDAGYPNWKGLFEPMAQALNLTITESTDFYKLAQYYANNFGQSELRNKINDVINTNYYMSPLLNELIETGFSNIWTTNFDNAIEMYYRNRNILVNKIFRDFDFSNIDINKRINIFKMNGDITNLDGIVATQSDYENYYDTHKLMMMFFKRELISSTFLFIGYSFTDHLILDCLSEITRYLGSSTNYHYTIMKKDTSNPYFNYFIDDLEQRYRIRVLLIDNFDELPQILRELNNRIRSKKVFISGAFKSYSKQIEDFSHNFSRKLTASLLEKDYRIVNGIGRRFGTHIIGYANEWLAKHGVKNVDRYLIVKPFVGNQDDSAKAKYKLREEIISKCGLAIFVFGDMDKNSIDSKSGVLEEFNIACKQHKVIIPIAYPKMISEQIWTIVKNNITEYPYLEKVINDLTVKQGTEILTNRIIHVLESINCSI